MPRLLLLTILLLSLAARLINLSGPPVGQHQWRQADTAGVARAYARAETGFFHPVVEWRGDTTGTAETEFPLYQYATGLAQRFLGLHDWVPRTLSILAGAATLAFFYLLVRLRSGPETAAWSLAVLALLPLLTFYSRTIQPDTWMLAAFTGSIYCMARWAARGRAAWLLASAVLASLAILLKLPSIVIGLPLAVLLFERLGTKAFRSPLPWIFAAVALIPPALWYAHAHSLGRMSGLSYGVLVSDKWSTFAPLLDPRWYENVLIRKVAGDHLAIIGALLAVLGMALGKRLPSERVFDAWTVAMAVHIALIPVGHAHHDYYQLPLLLPLAFFAGRFLAQGPLGPRPAIVRSACILLLAAGSAYTLQRLYRMELRRPLPEIELAAVLNDASRPDELVVLAVQPANVNDPTVLYLADRKGWTVASDRLTSALLDDLNRRGARVAAGARDIVRNESHFLDFARLLGIEPHAAPDIITRRLPDPE